MPLSGFDHLNSLYRNVKCILGNLNSKVQSGIQSDPKVQHKEECARLSSRLSKLISYSFENVHTLISQNIKSIRFHW